MESTLVFGERGINNDFDFDVFPFRLIRTSDNLPGVDRLIVIVGLEDNSWWGFMYVGDQTTVC